MTQQRYDDELPQRYFPENCKAAESYAIRSYLNLFPECLIVIAVKSCSDRHGVLTST